MHYLESSKQTVAQDVRDHQAAVKFLILDHFRSLPPYAQQLPIDIARATGEKVATIACVLRKNDRSYFREVVLEYTKRKQTGWEVRPGVLHAH